MSKIKNFVAAAWIGMASIIGCHGAIDKRPEERELILERQMVLQKEMVDEIIGKVDTADEAYNFVNSYMAFPKNHDKMLWGKDRWSSMLESYALGTGDCEDGAIMFRALLSDDPEYKVDILMLRNKNKGKPGHVITVYEKDSKFSYVSFNSSLHKKEQDISLDGTVKKFNKYVKNHYSKYSRVNFSDENLKYGTDLNPYKAREALWHEME